MTTGDESGRGPVAGRIFAAGGRLFVLSLPLSTALPIPLGVVAPAGLTLLTWAFVGLAPSDPSGPRGLLLLAGDEAAAVSPTEAGGRLTVATHYRDVEVMLSRAEPLADLPAEDQALLARAALSAGSPEVVDRLPDLFALIDQVDGLFDTTAESPRLTLREAGACTLEGTGVPNHLLLRGVAGWSLARVRAASLEFGAVPQTRLDLDGLPETSGGSAPDRAVGLHAHGFTPYRIGPAR